MDNHTFAKKLIDVYVNVIQLTRYGDAFISFTELLEDISIEYIVSNYSPEMAPVLETVIVGLVNNNEIFSIKVVTDSDGFVTWTLIDTTIKV